MRNCCYGHGSALFLSALQLPLLLLCLLLQFLHTVVLDDLACPSDNLAEPHDIHQVNDYAQVSYHVPHVPKAGSTLGSVQGVHFVVVPRDGSYADQEENSCHCNAIGKEELRRTVIANRVEEPPAQKRGKRYMRQAQ